MSKILDIILFALWCLVISIPLLLPFSIFWAMARITVGKDIVGYLEFMRSVATLEFTRRD